MTTTRRDILAAFGALGAIGLGSATGARAQAAWPSKPIRLVVPYAAGGGADNSARLFAQAMSPGLGQPIVIENKPGASGVIAASFVAQSPGDGYTALFDTFPATINAVARKLPFSFTKDLIPVSQAVDAPSVMVVAATSPFTSVKAFVDQARANPGKLTYASYGAGGAAHLAAELLSNQAHIEMIHVPYRGGAPALADLMGGQVNMYLANMSSALQFIKSGRLRALAVTSRERVPALADVPTFIELGYKDVEILEWNGFFLPGTTPQPIVQALAHSVQQAAQSADVRQRLAAVGLTAVGNTPQQFQAFLAGQMTKWSALIAANRIVLD